MDVFTFEDDETETEPSILSTAVAPSSVYDEPTSTVTLESPLTVITGGVVSGVGGGGGGGGGGGSLLLSSSNISDKAAIPTRLINIFWIADNSAFICEILFDITLF